ncbi:hypothetical protein Nepgr_030265 [Nepenthes gracilis]|uniref:Uncharacterized protein n=1 Tax=Nepenthes gracilis TaxID=150966 RepID=A0AAD3Y3R4_NEPGR|nr:hypothetical protein Nepgr_030265 [Nepenthes gracilis]
MNCATALLQNALVTELKCMHDYVTEDRCLQDVDSFEKQYAAVLVQLDNAFEQVCFTILKATEYLS